MGPSAPALVRDRFKEKADREAARRGLRLKGDAFAGTGVTKPANGDAFRNAASVKPRTAAIKPATPVPVMDRIKAKEKRASLHVVASQAEEAPVVQVAREEVRRVRPAAKPSSLVLVSSSNVVAAAEAPAETGPPEELEIPKLGQGDEKSKQRSGGGGGDGAGGAGGSGAGGGATAAPRDRIFNQDDLVSVLLVGVMLILLLLYLIRPGAQTAAAGDRMLNTQFAAAEPEAPPAPKPDPFGNRPVDLTPKSPLPPPAAEPSPPELVEITMHAWFCTAKSELTPATIMALDRQIADWGPKLTSGELVVLGYADTRGASEYNLSLGSLRAGAVADYLRSKGVKVAAASGVGELPDLTDNENCSNQRRVDVRLSGMPEEAPDRSCAPPRDFAELMCG
jgi:outer membrane protein OmpA-like peptidoglycan-associated protein